MRSASTLPRTPAPWQTTRMKCRTRIPCRQASRARNARRARPIDSAAEGSAEAAATVARGCCAATPHCVSVPACEGGRVASAATQAQCCWPGQTWDAARSSCAGAPTACGPGLYPVAERCDPVPTCEGGRVASAATAGACCWPGQTAASGACAGTPASCPTGYVVRATECVPTVEHARERVLTALNGRGWRNPEIGMHGFYAFQPGSTCALEVHETFQDDSPDPIVIQSQAGLDFRQATSIRVAPLSVSIAGPAWRESSVEPGRRAAPFLSFHAIGDPDDLARRFQDLATACGATVSIVVAD